MLDSVPEKVPNEADFKCSITCAICWDPVVTTCGHLFERSQILHWIFDENKSTCPMCRENIGKDDNGIPIFNDEESITRKAEIKAYLELHPDRKKEQFFYVDQFIQYIKDGRTDDAIKMIAGHNDQLNQPLNGQHTTALHLACQYNNTELATTLLRLGADLTIQAYFDGKKCTPIQIAVDKQHWELVQLFAQKGTVSTDDPEQFGDALLRACDHEKWEIVALLLQHSNISTKWYFPAGAEKGWFAFHYLVLHHQVDLIQKMLGHPNFDINQQHNSPTQTALIFAARDKRFTPETLQFLLANAKGIDLNKTQEGKTALHFAAETGQLEKVRMLLEAKADLTVQAEFDGKKFTLIQIAVDKQYWDVITLFAQYGTISKDDPEKFGDALLRACYHEKWDIVALLLQHSNISTTWYFPDGAEKGWFAFHYLVLHHQVDLIQKMLGHPNFDINQQHNSSTPTALIFAVKETRVTPETLQFLLANAKGIDLNKTQEGKTALHFAAETGQLEKVRMLLEAKADLTVQADFDGKKFTPIQIAVDKQYWDVITRFAQYGTISTDDPEKFGDALLRACYHEKWEIVALLLQHSNILTKWYFPDGAEKGWFAFHYLVLHHQVDLIQKMLGHPNFDINQQRDSSTPTALIFAARDKRFTPETLQCLLKNAKSIDLNKTQEGKTALHFAAETGQMEKVILLIQHGANIEIKDSNHKTALDLAVSHTHTNTQKAMQMQYWMQQNYDLGSTKNLAGIWIITRTQLNYILRYKKTLAGLGCKLHPNVDMTYLTFDQLALPCQDFSVLQYTIIVCNSPKYLPILNSFLKLKLPQLSQFYSYDQNKNIGELTNEEFLHFIQWLRELYDVFMRFGIKCPAQLQKDLKMFEQSLTYLLSRDVISSFAQRISKKLDKKEQACKKEIFLSHTFSDLFRSFYCLQNVALDKPFDDAIFHFYLYLACMFSRMRYLKLFTGNDLLKTIGITQSPIEDFDLNDLIFVGNNLLDLQIKIFVVDEVIDRLRVREEFVDPLTGRKMSDAEITACLKHPKIKEALQHCHEEKKKILAQQQEQPLKEIVQEFRSCGDALWNASIDSKRPIFDEKAANAAVVRFIKYVNSLDPILIAYLNERQYYLESRGCKTSFDALFKQATYGNCAGQLGVAIKQWASRFEQDRNFNVGETPFSKYFSLMPPPNQKSMFPIIPEDYGRKGRVLSTVVSQSMLSSPSAFSR